MQAAKTNRFPAVLKGITAVPGPALLRIEHTADAMYHNFKTALERDIAIYHDRMYFRMLDALSISDLVEFMNSAKEASDESKMEILKALYLERA